MRIRDRHHPPSRDDAFFFTKGVMLFSKHEGRQAIDLSKKTCSKRNHRDISGRKPKSTIRHLIPESDHFFNGRRKAM